MVMTNFGGKITRPLDVLPADIIGGDSTTVSVFFVMHTASNYNALAEARFMLTRVSHPLCTNFYLFFGIGVELE